MHPLTSAGTLDIEALLALHRSTFGSARMDAGDDGQTDDPDDASNDAGADDQGDDAGDGKEPDWQAKFAAQQKVARDLEKKLKASSDSRSKIAELERQLAAAQGKEQEYAALQAQREADQAAISKANERILRSEIKAAAAGALADPADALKLLDLSDFEVDDDGNVDEQAIAEAIAELVKNKPYLAAQGGKRFNGSGDGGRRKDTPPAPKSLQEAVTRALSSGGSTR